MTSQSSKLLSFAFALAFLPLANLHGASMAMVNAKSFGMVGDGVHDDGPALLSALRSGKNLQLPAGTYLIRNSGPIAVQNFSAGFVSDAGAKLLFINPKQLGLVFTGGTGAKVINLNVNYSPAPTVRMAGSAVEFHNTQDTYLSGATINASPGGGISFSSCVRPIAVNSSISNTMADGLFFENSDTAVVDTLTTNNTGDDGLAVHNFTNAPQESNGMAMNIHVNNSKARGISCSGCKDFTVSKFTVQNTSAQGLQIDRDQVYASYQPSNVTAREGTIINAGTLSPTTGNGFGIELDDSLQVVLQNISVKNSANRGVNVGSPSGSTSLINVQVSGTDNGGSGFDLQSQNLYLVGSGASETAGPCVAVTYSGTVVLDKFTANNCSKANSMHRAIDIEQTNSLQASFLTITDNQAQPTGTTYLDYAVHSGYVQNISYSIPNGSFVLGSNSGTVNIGSVTRKN